MHASFMNPHRAIEYLCNPSSMPAVPPPQAAAPAGGAPTPAAGRTSSTFYSAVPRLLAKCSNLWFFQLQQLLPPQPLPLLLAVTRLGTWSSWETNLKYVTLLRFDKCTVSLLRHFWPYFQLQLKDFTDLVTLLSTVPDVETDGVPRPSDVTESAGPAGPG